ncbi:ribonuclease HII [Kocuria dechangensis]|uniref:Ribonuclease HII n=1 Tax=Kocuria dechangensis TaxID=1176249 RepID=A0A917H1Y9_9MICC|nr:ribonuclease HII [Kocuria dechangensis]GGG64924.1 ribonuclease HII [Kocuria dechangensis]
MAPDPRRPRTLRGAAPGLAVERELSASGALVAGMDEVGRGALAGPVTVGVVVLRPGTALGVPGLRDSKLLSPARREELVPRILAWCAAGGVGHASPQEIDGLGLTAALRRAGHRALTAAGLGAAPPDVVLLDGRHDWLSRPAEPSLLDALGPAAGAADEEAWSGRVVPRVKADLTCASVAAASVLAKVERDRIMGELSGDWPQYGWGSNKGYGAAEHRRALADRGPTPHHRLSWRLTQPPVPGGNGTSGDETT